MPTGSGGGRPLGSQNVPLQQGPLADGYPLIVEDLGTNTNTRQYEKENGFYSAPTTVGAAATALYTEATDPARTDGEEVTIYSLHIYNVSGAAGQVWLEIGGVEVTVYYQIANTDTVCIDFPAGLTLGDNDINVNGTADIVVQISGTEA